MCMYDASRTENNQWKRHALLTFDITYIISHIHASSYIMYNLSYLPDGDQVADVKMNQIKA